MSKYLADSTNNEEQLSVSDEGAADQISIETNEESQNGEQSSSDSDNADDAEMPLDDENGSEFDEVDNQYLTLQTEIQRLKVVNLKYERKRFRYNYHNNVLIPGEIRELDRKVKQYKNEIKELKKVVSIIDQVKTEALQTIDLTHRLSYEMADFSDLAVAMTTESSEAQSNETNARERDLQVEIEKVTAEYESLPNVKLLRQLQKEVSEKEQQIINVDEEMKKTQNTADINIRKIEKKQNEIVLNMVLTRHEFQKIEKENTDLENEVTELKKNEIGITNEIAALEKEIEQFKIERDEQVKDDALRVITVADFVSTPFEFKVPAVPMKKVIKSGDQYKIRLEDLRNSQKIKTTERKRVGVDACYSGLKKPKRSREKAKKINHKNPPEACVEVEIPVIFNDVVIPTISAAKTPFIRAAETPFIRAAETPFISAAETPFITAAEIPFVSAAEIPFVSAAEIPFVSAAEIPFVSAAEFPFVSAAEIPFVSAAETPFISVAENTKNIKTTHAIELLKEPEMTQKTKNLHKIKGKTSSQETPVIPSNTKTMVTPEKAPEIDQQQFSFEENFNFKETNKQTGSQEKLATFSKRITENSISIVSTPESIETFTVEESTFEQFHFDNTIQSNDSDDDKNNGTNNVPWFGGNFEDMFATNGNNENDSFSFF